MIEIKETLISDELLDRKFVCDLSACKGACCVEGDSGAPLSEEECGILEEIHDQVLPYMTEKGKEVVAEVGNFVIDTDGDPTTPLIENRQCAYVFYDKGGVVKCAIEKAYQEGKIDFRKPISCHLFPVRLKEYKTFTAVNLQWLEICDAACDLGQKLKVPVYQFLKEPLIRRFGEGWYKELESIAQVEE